MARLWWTGAILALLGVLVCAPAAGATSWNTALGQAAAAPRVSKTAALQLYALALGPVPGVKVSRKGVGRIDSADPARDAVLVYYRQLSAKQRRAVGLRVVRRHPRGHRATAAQATFYPTIDPLPAGRKEDEALTKIANVYRGLFAERLKVKPSWQVHVYRTALAFGRVGPLGESLSYGPKRALDAAPVTCEIEINRLNTLVAKPGPALEETLTHEVFHCFQAQIVGSAVKLGVLSGRSPWLVEGGAEWAGCQAQVGPIGQWWFETYIDASDASLFARSYDALGVFDEVASVGVDPFTTMVAALNGGTEVGSYNALAGTAEQRLEESLAASFAQDDSRGQAWRISAPCYRPRAAERTRLTLTPGAPQRLEAGKAAGTTYELALDGGDQVLTVDVDSGRARISGGGVDDPIAPSADPTRYCVGTCTCATGIQPQNTIAHGGPAVLVALTGNPQDGGKATVTTEPVKCPVITSATFTSSSATFSNVSDPVNPAFGYQWSSTESWNVAFARTALSVGSYAVGTVVASGGAFTTTRPMNPTCTGSLSLTTADSPKDPWLKVLSDEGAGTGRHWRVSLTPTSYGNFFVTDFSCPGPDFGFNVMRPLWTATVDLHATAQPTEHTETFAVASDPAHSGKENWTGTVTITGTW